MIATYHSLLRKLVWTIYIAKVEMVKKLTVLFSSLTNLVLQIVLLYLVRWKQSERVIFVSNQMQEIGNCIIPLPKAVNDNIWSWLLVSVLYLCVCYTCTCVHTHTHPHTKTQWYKHISRPTDRGKWMLLFPPGGPWAFTLPVPRWQGWRYLGGWIALLDGWGTSLRG